MNFQDLKSVENSKYYIDLAFSRAKNCASKLRTKSRIHDKTKKSKEIELAKLSTIKDILLDHLMKILRSYPSIDQLPLFYQELVKCTLDYPQLKKSLGAINWAVGKIKDFTTKYLINIKRCDEINRINGYRREYYGRISSVVKQINKNLEFLESSRKIMKSYPHIKTSLKTVAIVGFPNVGKTTLLSKLTGSTPEIKPYAFTTKNINVGYINQIHRKIQLLDTPGTLNRFEKMNNIEKQSYLAIKYCASLLIYVFDLTESSYHLKDQIKLYNELKKSHKVLAYISKADLINKEQLSLLRLKHLSFEELKKELESLA